MNPAIWKFLLAILTALNAPPHRPAPVTREPARVKVSRGAPRTTPPPRGPCGGWRYLVDRYGDWDANRVCRIMGCESGYRPNARNGRYVGLMQIGGGTTDPAANIAQAHAMWQRRGFQPWECQ